MKNIPTTGALYVGGHLHLLRGTFEELGPHLAALILLSLLLCIVGRCKPAGTLSSLRTTIAQTWPVVALQRSLQAALICEVHGQGGL